MALADLVVVMNDGQDRAGGARARDVFDQPATAFVARFIGGHNVVCRPRVGARSQRASGEFVAIRADRITVQPRHRAASTPAVARRASRARSSISARPCRSARRRRPRDASSAVVPEARFDANPVAPGRAGGSVVDAQGRACPRAMSGRTASNKQGDVEMTANDETAKDAECRTPQRPEGRGGASPARPSAAAPSPASRRSGRRHQRSRCASSAPACRTSTPSPRSARTTSASRSQMTALDSDAVAQRAVTQPNSLRHRRHRILDAEEGLPGRRDAADGRQEDQVLRQDRAALHHRQADARQRRSRRARRRTPSASSTAPDRPSLRQRRRPTGSP